MEEKNSEMTNSLAQGAEECIREFLQKNPGVGEVVLASVFFAAAVYYLQDGVRKCISKH